MSKIILASTLAFLPVMAQAVPLTAMGDDSVQALSETYQGTADDGGANVTTLALTATGNDLLVDIAFAVTAPDDPEIQSGFMFGTGTTADITMADLMPFTSFTETDLEGVFGAEGTLNDIALAENDTIYAFITGGGSFTMDDEGTTGITATGVAQMTPVAPVPLPASALLLVGALGGLGFVRRRKSA